MIQELSKKKFLAWTAVLSCWALFFVFTGAATAHPLRDDANNTITIILKDADGQPITATSGNNAFSAKTTCGVCHHPYNNIEWHSYHAQLGANEQKGWNPYNANSSDKYLRGPATKKKPWVQSTGHVGKW